MSQQLETSGLQSKNLESLLEPMIELLSAMRSRNKFKKESKLKTDKELHEKAVKVIGSLDRDQVSLNFKYEIDCGIQMLASLPDDEPTYQIVLRKALNLAVCVKSISALVASQGTAFEEYVTLLKRFFYCKSKFN